MSENETKPWWKFGYVWMVIGGPAVVVVAGLATLYLAVSSPDPIIRTDSAQGAAQSTGQGLAPAVQARNHAATGVPVPASRQP